MANHAEGWAPGALVRFGSLYFIVTIRGGLEQIQAPKRSSGVSAVTDMLQGLRLHCHEQGAPVAPPRSGFDSARME